MYSRRMQSCLLLAALLAACSERNAPTAPVARPLAATASVDRPYTWGFTCQGGDIYIRADWSWTENGTVIASASSPYCYNGTYSGTGVRPANANGFTATVGDNSQSWTLEPAGSFKAGLTGSVEYGGGRGGGCKYIGCFPKVSNHGKLNVDS